MIAKIVVNGSKTSTFHSDAEQPGVSHHQSPEAAQDYAKSVVEANPSVEVVDETPKPEAAAEAVTEGAGTATASEAAAESANAAGQTK